MDRRAFLSALGLVAGASAIGACAPSPDTAGPAAGASADPLTSALSRVAPEADPTLSVVVANFELLTGDSQPFAFGLRDIDNEPINDAVVDVYVMTPDGDADGPHRATYCQTAVCGPSVEVMDSVRQRREWGDAAWIHVEIYSDDGQTLAKPVKQWDLPTEPWLFAIDRDGIVVERRDGPLLVLADQVAAVAEQIA